MLRTFNTGIGLIAIVPPERVPDAIGAFAAHGQHAVPIGTLIAGTGESLVRYRGELAL
jgi:phosphoribosylformylglycinamidine cyclo-ligase